MNSAHARGLSALLEDYDNALTKLASLGVRTKNGRLRSYRSRVVEAIAAESAAPNSDFPHQSDPEFLNALLEMREIIDIGTLDVGLLSAHETLTKLRQICRGPDVLNPAKDDPGRNYAFEFSTAAQAACNGRLVGFQAGDLEIGPPNCPVECKRISSLKQLGPNIAAARAQLAAGGRPGIIALDLSAPIRSERGIAVACASEAEQRISVDQELTAYLIRNLDEEHLEGAMDPAVLGMIVRHRLVGSVGPTEQIRASQTWQLFSLYGDTRDETFTQAAQFLGDEPILAGTIEDIESSHRTIFGEVQV